MIVQPGARLGPHEIVTAIGAGGMSEVWLARDMRLDRDVAIKGPGFRPAPCSSMPTVFQTFAVKFIDKRQ